ncbi:MAG: NAD(+) synthase [Planctomycetota bacterium]
MPSVDADLKFDPAKVCDVVGEFLRASLARLEADGFVLGLSGGVDSAVVAALVCRTIGPGSLLGMMLPDLDSDPQSETDARLVAKAFGFEVRRQKTWPALKKLGVYNIFWPIYYLPRSLKRRIYEREHAARNQTPGQVFLDTRLGTRDKDLRRFNAFLRAKGRMRTLALYIPAELENRLVVGTTNYSEYIIGWFTKWGDSLSDISPIVDLYKTQVWEMARYLGVPEKIIHKRPSPDLVAGLFDEDGIGMPYRTLDLILAGINRGLPDAEIAKQADMPVERVGYVYELIRRSQHMRDMPTFPNLGIGKRIYSASEIGTPPGRGAEAAD